MAIEFRLPDIGEGIDVAELVSWLVAAGDPVREDDPLAEIETDKAIAVIPCPTTGTVVKLCAEPGDRIPVGAVLAVFEPGETNAAQARADSERASSAAPTPDVFGATASEPGPARSARPLASPAIRKLARELGVDLATLAGSGPGGRIARGDLDDARGVATVTATSTPPPAAGRAGQVVPLKGVRRSIARALTDAWQTIPHIIDYREVDASALIRARQALKAHADRNGDEALARAMTITPLVLKMAVRALARHPYANASIDLEREQITLHAHYHIGIATATPDGLVVPVVHDADLKSVPEVALEISELAAGARERRLTREQLSGGTFTVNNYGGLGVWLGTPIIKPPEVVNLGIGRVQDRAVVVDGEVTVRPIMPLAVSGDHRVLDGHTLGAFVSDLVALIEDPYLLLETFR